jgi:hypothetical protein
MYMRACVCRCVYVCECVYYKLKTLYRSYFKRISANIALQVYNVTCCRPYLLELLKRAFPICDIRCVLRTPFH